MTINLDNVTNITSFTDVLDTVNSESGQMMGVFLLITIFGVSYLATYKIGGDPNESFFAATFISSFLGLFIWILGFLPDLAFYIMAIGTATVLSASIFRK